MKGMLQQRHLFPSWLLPAARQKRQPILLCSLNSLWASLLESISELEGLDQTGRSRSGSRGWGKRQVSIDRNRTCCRTSYLLVDQVDGTPNIDVHKVHINCLVEELCTFGHCVWKRSLQLPKGDSLYEFNQQLFSSELKYHLSGYQDDSSYLHPKNIFSVVPFEESPLRGLALKQVCAHSHLSTGDVCPKAFAYPSEREVTTLKETG